MTFRERFEKVIEGRAEEGVKPYIMSLRSIDRTSLPEAYIFGYHEAAQDLLPLIEELISINDSDIKWMMGLKDEGSLSRTGYGWLEAMVGTKDKMMGKLNAFLGEGGENDPA